MDPGFEARRLTLEVQASGPRYAEDAAVYANHDQLRQALAAIPGVSEVGLANQFPLSGNMDMYGVRAQDKPLANPELAPSADRYVVSPGFLQALRIPLLRGRAFTEADSRDSAQRVAIVSAALAARIWPGEDPLGRRVQVGGSDSPWRGGASPQRLQQRTRRRGHPSSLRPRRHAVVRNAVTMWSSPVASRRAGGCRARAVSGIETGKAIGQWRRWGRLRVKRAARLAITMFAACAVSRCWQGRNLRRAGSHRNLRTRRSACGPR